MAKLKGIIRIEGTLHMNFYKTEHGHLVKTKSGVSGDRIAMMLRLYLPARMGAEFGTAAKAGKIMRDAFRVLIRSASDNRVTSRLTQSRIKLILLFLKENT